MDLNILCNWLTGVSAKKKFYQSCSFFLCEKSKEQKDSTSFISFVGFLQSRIMISMQVPQKSNTWPRNSLFAMIVTREAKCENNHSLFFCQFDLADSDATQTQYVISKVLKSVFLCWTPRQPFVISNIANTFPLLPLTFWLGIGHYFHNYELQQWMTFSPGLQKNSISISSHRYIQVDYYIEYIKGNTIPNYLVGAKTDRGAKMDQTTVWRIREWSIIYYLLG
jgi:hypothetical protein